MFSTEIEWEDLSLNQNMKRIKIILLILFISVLMLWNRDDAYEEESIEVEQESITWAIEDGLIEKLDNLLGDYITSEIIVDNCFSKVEDYTWCIKNVIGVANAESSLFKKVSRTNNPFGLMKGGRLQKFASKYDAIIYRIDLYQSNWWYKRTTWADWLRWNYCASDCTYWVNNYNDWIAKLGLD